LGSQTFSKWVEIARELKPGQSATDRPDLIARVFRMKMNELIEDLTKNDIFGKGKASVYGSSRREACHTSTFYSSWIPMTNPVLLKTST
jgi:hypothetical protein